ncbi:MAG: hypothetical protein RIT17_1509 [Pseudomonadota bacterium]|jgi:hypothetical protein
MKPDCRQNATVPTQPEGEGVHLIAMHAPNDIDEPNPGIRP